MDSVDGERDARRRGRARAPAAPGLGRELVAPSGCCFQTRAAGRSWSSPSIAARSSPRGLAVLQRDVVELVGDALAAVAGRVRARLKAPGEGDGLALDQVRGGRLGLAAPEDQVDVDGVRLAVAAIAGHADGRDAVPAVGAAQLDVASEAAVAGKGEHLR